MIVIFFVLLFAGYLCLSINQNKAFAVKNAIVRITERHGLGVNNADGLASQSKWKEEITKELKDVGYNTRGKCDDGWTGFNVKGEVRNDNDVFFCIRAVKSTCDSGCEDSHSNPNTNLHYFEIKTFYHFNIPIFRTFFNLVVEGTTKPLRSYEPKSGFPIFGG